MGIKRASFVSTVLLLGVAALASPSHACGPENDSSITRTKAQDVQPAKTKAPASVQSGTAESAASSQPKKPSK